MVRYYFSTAHDIQWALTVTENTTVTHRPQNKQKKIFLTIAEIHDPNFITSKI